mgnify:CR=1 FL=1
MIKCFRDGGETIIEADGPAMQVAADCCEIIAAIYREAPFPAREVFKKAVLLAATHEDSPMWSLEKRGGTVTFSTAGGELERQMEEFRRKRSGDRGDGDE